MKLFQPLIFHGDTVTVKCPDCGYCFIENDTVDAVAACPKCPAQGYIDNEISINDILDMIL